MTINSRQMQVLRAAQEAAFKDRLLDHCRQCFPTRAALPDWESDALQAIARACTVYRLRTERDLSAFVDLCGAFGWDFDTRPENEWMRCVLHDAVVTSPGERVHRLVRLCVRRDTIARENEAVRAEFLSAAQ